MGQEAYFDRNTTGAVKGIALVMMFFHHFFTFTSWYIPGVYFPVLSPIAAYLSEPSKMCVAVFAFLNGYFYAFKKDRSIRHTARKISDFLISYWIVYGILFAVAWVAGKTVFDPQEVAFELFALHRPVMCFCWYVYFYCLSLLILPGTARLMDRNLPLALAGGLVLPLAVFFGLACLVTPFCTNDLTYALMEVLIILGEWFPIMAIGYLVGRYDLFRRILDPILKDHLPRLVRTPALLLLLVASCAGRYFLPGITCCTVQPAGFSLRLYLTMDILYAPLFVYSLVNLIECFRWRPLDKALSLIGEHSMYMWFFHCIFFNGCRVFTQPVLFLPRPAPLVLMWGLILCLCPSIPVKWTVDRLLRAKHRLLFDQSEL